MTVRRGRTTSPRTAVLTAATVAALACLQLATVADASERSTRLTSVARIYSLGIGEVRCATAADLESDDFLLSRWGYTNVRRDFAVLAPHVCDGALNVANADVPAWQRAVGTLILVHEAFHLRHWRFRRNEGKVECQAIVYFKDAAEKLGASATQANDLYPYALAWHWRQLQLRAWYRDRACIVPPWIPPVA